MKNEDRRKELGKMLMDVAKYLATVGLIGNLLVGEKINVMITLSIIVVTILFVVVAFYIIPARKEG